jgi:solute carrier family 45 protein 1/2/4
MENVVTSRRSISLTLVYPWQARRSPGPSNWGNFILALILGVLLTTTAPRYGTPFLLNLGVSEQLTSLVWLAGPISGLIAQPVIGEPALGLTF